MRAKEIGRGISRDWWLKATLSLILVLAVLFRVVNLEDKPYWNMDEAYTLLRASGYTAEEATQGILQGEVVALSDFQKYLEPSREQGARGTIAGLAKEEPQHPPFYYLLARFWQQWFGTSKAARRSLPVLFSLLTFPAIYWLCRELFDRPLVAWLTMTLYGVSPVMLEFATFIRPYSLFLLETVVASAILLRSLRQETKLGWILYAATMAIAFYTHLLAGLVAIAHGIYVLISERFRFSPAVRRFLLSGISVTVIALPWFYVVWQNLQTAQRTTDWTKNASPFFDLVQLWLKYLNRGFFAWHFQYEAIFSWAIIPLFILICYSFYFFCRNAPFKTRIFVLTLLGTSFLPFLLADLILGGARSTAYRFFLICYVGMDIVIAYLLASKLSLEIEVLRKPRFWSLVSAILFAASSISCGVGAFGNSWWGYSEFNNELIEIVSATSQPLIVAECPQCLLYDKFYYPMTFDSRTHVLILERAESFYLPSDFENIFLFAPSDRLLSEVSKRGVKSKLVYQFRDPTTNFELTLHQLKLAGSSH